MIFHNWMWVDVEKGEIHLSVSEPRRGRREIRPARKFRYKPQWLGLLARICEGEWVDWSQELSNSLAAIFKHLDAINLEYGTSFALGGRCLKGKQKPQIGLIGG